jgi:hypothetical protein
MFINDPDMTTLRQGDVIADVVFPLVRLDRPTVFLGTYSPTTRHLEPIIEETRRSRYQSAQVSATVSLAAVFSQDCDVDNRQEHPPPAFLLCRVMQVWDSLRRSPGYSSLQENIDPYGEGRPYYQLYYLGEILGYEGEFLTDYSQVVTVSWADYRHVLGRKLLELDKISRSKFRVKAGAHVGRPSAEEIADGIADPWHPTAPSPDSGPSPL